MPSSTSIMAATLVTGLVIEAIQKIASGCSGMVLARSRKPTARRYATLPFRAIAATAQQYPVRMAELGVAAGVAYLKTGKKPSGYTDTGVALIAAKPMPGVDSKDVKTGMELCFGRRG